MLEIEIHFSYVCVLFSSKKLCAFCFRHTIIWIKFDFFTLDQFQIMQNTYSRWSCWHRLKLHTPVIFKPNNGFSKLKPLNECAVVVVVVVVVIWRLLSQYSNWSRIRNKAQWHQFTEYNSYKLQWSIGITQKKEMSISFGY